MRWRGSTSRRLDASTSRSVPIDSASSASVIVRSRAAAISRASGSPSTRPTSSATRCRSNVPSRTPGAAAAARWRNSSTAGESGPAVGSGASGDDVLAVERQRLAARRQQPQPVAAAQQLRDDARRARRGRARSCRARAGRRWPRRRPASGRSEPAPQVEGGGDRRRDAGPRRRPGPARRRRAPRPCRRGDLARDVDGQARLADAAGPDERDEAGRARSPRRRRAGRPRARSSPSAGPAGRRDGHRAGLRPPAPSARRLQRLALGAAQVEAGHEPGVAQRGRRPAGPPATPRPGARPGPAPARGSPTTARARRRRRRRPRTRRPPR